VKKEAAEAGRTWRIVLFNSNHQQWGGDCWVCEARLYFAVDQLVVPGYWPPTPPTTATHRPEKGTAAVTGVLAFHSNYIDPFPPLPPVDPLSGNQHTNREEILHYEYATTSSLPPPTLIFPFHRAPLVIHLAIRLGHPNVCLAILRSIYVAAADCRRGL